LYVYDGWIGNAFSKAIQAGTLLTAGFCPEAPGKLGGGAERWHAGSI